MTLLHSIQALPKNEKLMIMECLWQDLSRNDEEFESPDWHKVALTETEQRLKDGSETILDWNIAKRQLRKQFE